MNRRITLSERDDLDNEGKHRGTIRVEVDEDTINKLLAVDVDNLTEGKSIEEQPTVAPPTDIFPKKTKLKGFGYTDEQIGKIQMALNW